LRAPERLAPPLAQRPERLAATVDANELAVASKPLSGWETVAGNSFLRKTVILIVLAGIWELYGRHLNNQLLVPTFSATVAAFVNSVLTGELLLKVWVSIKVLLVGYAAGVALAAVLTAFATTTRVGADLLETLTAMFNPLPAIALLPLALIWFGLTPLSLSFVLIHSVLWPVALNTHSGFVSVSPTLRMVGKNYGLRGLRYVALILIPAAFPSILTGLKIGWAFAWRTLIAAELIFGVQSGSGGLGWFIVNNKNILDIPNVFAGLLTVIIIGLLVENVIFRSIEARTIRRWGMATS
jgi:NitT/TauT family transport system permease protein